MDYVVEMLNITKEFPGIKAVDNVTLQLKRNEIHALLGENGAGKSTLMSVLFGLYKAEEGKIILKGKDTVISGPSIASKLGIGMVHQHFKLVDNFTVVENIILGQEPVKGIKIDYRSAREKVIKLSEKYNLNVDPDALIENISVGMQQRVEILKMLYRNADILIFDEPTAVLTPQEIEELIAIMNNLIKEDKSIILITHKLSEIKTVANRCTVLRRGKYIGTINVADTNEQEMANMMVGREVSFNVNKKEASPTDIILEVNNLYVKNDKKVDGLKDVSFTLRKGEVLGVAGIEGNGQSELVFALTGMKKVHQGSVIYKNKDITNLSVKQRYEIGIGHIPEDRHKHGLVLDFDIAENVVIHDYETDKYSNGLFIDFKSRLEVTNQLITDFDVRCSNASKTIVRSMSGGNQQKIIIAREINLSPDLLIIVQPTRGLDVGAIEYIHSRIIQERDNGKAILLVSLELDEVINLSDRIMVMYDGTCVGEVIASETNENELGLMMGGIRKGGPNNE